MAEKDSKLGYGHGNSGQPNQNPNDRGVISRSVDILTDVVTGNVANTTQRNDQNAKDYDDAHKAGAEDRKK